nr:hypothetical protein [Tanacetum cinerariifolium]
MVSYKGDLHKLLLVQVMVAPIIPISVGSSVRNFECAIDIDVDVIHPVPVALVFSCSNRCEDSSLTRGENASLRYTIRTMEAVETVTRKHERLARMEIKR